MLDKLLILHYLCKFSEYIFRIQHRLKAIPYNPSTQTNQAWKQPKTAPQIWAHSHNLEHQKMNKMHQWKAKNSRIKYLLVGVSRNTRNESKMQPKMAWGSKNHELSLFEWGGEVFGWRKCSPPLFFYNLVQGLLTQASSARLGELTLSLFSFSFFAKPFAKI